MKVCPICQSSYEATVDFCFKDGAPLESQEEAAETQRISEESLAGITADDLEPPDAISLSNIPAVDIDDDLITQTLPVDLPDAEELDRSHPHLEAIEEPPERDVTGIVDPFGGHEEEKFRARLAAGSDPSDMPDDPSGLPDAVFPPDDEEDEDEEDEVAAAAPTADPVPEPLDADEADEADEDDLVATAPKIAAVPPARPPKPKSAAKPKPKSKPAPEPRARPRKRPEDFGREEKKDNKGLFFFLGAVALLAIIFIGWQATKGPADDGGEPVVDAVTPPPTHAATPAPTPEPVTPDEPTGDELAGEEGGEPGEGEELPGEGEELGEDPTEDEAVTDAGAVEDPAEAARRREEERQRREERRREREEERRRQAEAAAASATPEPTPERATPSGVPEPPFSTGGEEPTLSTGSNPWATGSTTPAPTPAPTDPSNPWGAVATAEAEVTISSTPAGAKVSVGGRFRGNSPLKLVLAAGTHEVRVEQAGYATQTRYVKVEGTAPVSLPVTLEPLARIATGTLMVASSTPAMLFIDGAQKGRTPISVAITAGSHRFKLVTDDGRTLEQTVPIEVEEGVTVNRFFQIPD
jgi:hypothetical protein